MSNVAVSVCVLCAKLRGQQLTMSHQSRGPPATPAQMFQMVNRLIKQTGTMSLIHLITGWTSEALSEKLTDCWCTSKACWILSLLPASPGRQELNDCVFSEICPPSRLSSGSRVSDHSLHTPSSQDVSSTLHTEPLGREGECNRLTNQYFGEHLPILHFRNSRTSTSNTNT